MANYNTKKTKLIIVNHVKNISKTSTVTKDAEKNNEMINWGIIKSSFSSRLIIRCEAS